MNTDQTNLKRKWNSGDFHNVKYETTILSSMLSDLRILETIDGQTGEILWVKVGVWKKKVEI